MTKRKIIISVICLVFIVVFCYIAITGKIYTLDELPLNFMSAFLGAIVTGVLTFLLLEGQTKAEEVKERNVKVFEKKSLLFEAFNCKLLDIVKSQKINANDYIKLKSEYYSKLMLYLNEKSQNKIINYLANLGNCVGISIDAGIYSLNQINSNYEYMREQINNIINVLAEDLNIGGKINVSSQRQLDNAVFPQLFRELLLEEINNIFMNEKIFNKAKYRGMAYGTFLVLELNGNYTHGGGIHIGPFFNYTANEKFPAYEGIKFRFFSPLLNPISELYTVNDGTNIEKLIINFEGSKKGLLDLQKPLESWVFNKINVDSNIYNEEIDEIRFDDPNTLYKYVGIYKNIAKAIAARTFYYYIDAKTKNENLTIKELYDKFEKIKPEQYFDHIMKNLTTSVD